MFFRMIRTVAVLVLASAILSGCAKTTAQAPLPASPQPVDAGAPVPVAVVGAAETPSDGDIPAPTVAVVYSQPSKSSGGLIPSSWRDPGGSDTDRWIWENFGFENAQTITEIRWRGGYDPAKRGSGGPVRDFTVDIYPSIPAGTEPDVANAPLVHYEVGGNADESAGRCVGWRANV